MRPLASGWVSSEFWLAVAALAGKVVVLLLTLRVISTTDPNALTQSITEVILAVGTVWGLSHTSATYAANRTALKAEAVKAAQAAGTVRVIDRRTSR